MCSAPFASAAFQSKRLSFFGFNTNMPGGRRFDWLWYDYQEMNIKLCIPGFAQLKPTAPKREKILAAATELLLTEGFHALTQHAVATRAGIRQSHLTYYFPTRNDLLRATAQYGVETLLAPLGALVATVRQPPGSAGGVPTVEQFRQLLTPEKTDRQWFRLLVGLLVASDEDPGISQWLQEFDARVISILGAGFAAVGTPVSTEQLHFLRCAFTGALHLDMQAPTDESFQRVVRTVEMALDAILTSQPPPAVTNPSLSSSQTSEFTP